MIVQGNSTVDVVRRSIKQEFERFSSTREVRLSGKSSEQDEIRLNSLCKRPEFGVFLGFTTFRFDNKHPGLGISTVGQEIKLRPDILNNTLVSLILVRHAFELSTLQHLLPGQNDSVTKLVIAALAYHSTAAYFTILPYREKQEARKNIPHWIVDLADYGLGNPDILLEKLRKHAREILVLQGFENELISELTKYFEVESMVRVLLRETISLGYPTEWLLTQGGDNRLLIDPETGLNKYGCSPKPRSWAVTFASCTGTSISDLGYLTAEKLRQELLLGAFRNGLGQASLDQAERTRREIIHTFDLDRIPGTEIILASSGTDIELIALYLTLGGHYDEVTNILIAPDEVGSGTVSAAGGFHFDTLTPMGSKVEPGTPVAGIDPGRVALVEVPIRNNIGERIEADELDRQIFEIVDQVCMDGGRVLLHLLDSSKTGVGAPSIETACKIKNKYGHRVNVLVDAAQMRLSRQALQNYIIDGFLVLVTGSKFFTGPPLSGALIIPPPIAREVDSFAMFPEGLADYATQSDFPNRWHGLTFNLPNITNVGLLLRWQAALWEIKAFYNVTPVKQFDTVRQFLTTLISAIQKNNDLELLTAPTLERQLSDSEDHWDRIQTIFSFLVKRKENISGKLENLSFDETHQIYRWLNMDIARFLPAGAQDNERQIGGIRCHIGQPVRIYKQNGIWYAALRIAIGARLISGVEFDPMLGLLPEKRLETELQGALTILKKISVIISHWDYLSTTDIDQQHKDTVDGFCF